MKTKLLNIAKNYPDLTAFLLFVLVAVIAYWQVAFLSYSLKWDMLDCYLPWRYFVGECWQEGSIPFWNPYQHFGYPIHADMRSAWNPESFIIGLAGGYTNITLHFLSILYLSLAGLGMYKLSTELNNNRQIGIITGMAYMLSGFFIGHGQDISFFISGALVTWVLYYYLRLSKKGDMLNTLKAALAMLLMVFAAYPAYTIFLNYILPILFFYYLINLIRNKNKKQGWRFIGHNVLLYAIVICGSLILIFTYTQIAPFTERFAGIAYQDFITNPFSPQSLISWLAPFVTLNNHEIFQSDISMINGYWGILMMVFSVFAFRKRNPIVIIFLAISILSLLLSFGPYTPIHPLFYKFAPGFSLFRMPAIFILFTIIGLLLMASQGLKNIVENFDRERKNLIRVVGIFIAVIGIGFIIGLIYFPYQDTVFFNGPKNIRGFLDKIS
ncbi:hypothetical protein, partial [Candidatus Venteria ishoeyi]|uniref:hypothetical protein n=1 Tax=Candidatus Venteria ishoeyi TaxID=1899563 RepID=UPI0011B035D3